MKIKSAVNILTYAAADGQIDEVIKQAIQTVLPLLEQTTKVPSNLQLNGEEWRDVRGYEGLYQVSNYGRVKSLHHVIEWILKLTTTSDGYVMCSLHKNGRRKSFQVHRLVAEAFLPNPDNLPQVDHLNGNRADNRLENLKWVSSSENMRSAFERRHKISAAVRAEIRRLYAEGFGSHTLSKKYKVSVPTILRIVKSND